MDAKHYNPKILVKAREEKQKTQQNIADLLKVDRQTIYRVEAGITASYDILAAICAVYELPLTEVIYPFPNVAIAA
jgi:transcriptional regulator with XRE-family HTH domain